ncbi:MAG TPA: mechanosensitive ion channel, partial [Aestuariivirga sp.]|nr:mechanosensitive ion channel [Aestuariivirga sp.]
TGFVRFLPMIWLALGVAAAALLLGYVALAYFVAGPTFRTALILSVLALVHHLIDAASAALTDRATALGRAIRRFSSMGERGIERLTLALRTISDVVLVAIGVPWLLAIWTVTWIDLRSLLTQVALGFKVGSITVSPGSMVLMLATLAAVIVLTRLFTRWLDRRVLSEMRLNKGVQDSIHTGANYLGYVLAGAVALSVMGIDLSNIAIVAGALGVGIGFGLQSIVNNFVSGLILLAERPIRVGDWVVTTAGEGIVRKINVRSTEIETFDNCSIIVPNSDLITEPVKNWMHRSTNGRFTVPVTVAYGSDARAVAELLLAEARKMKGVSDVPPPLAQLTRLGPQGLEFELKAHVPHVFDVPEVASNLRLAILEAFAKNRVTIPAAPAAPAAKPKRKP